MVAGGVGRGGSNVVGAGSSPDMAVVLIVLLVLALIFGVGAVLEGLAWMFLITAALIVTAAVFGWVKLRGALRR